jgi:glycosyltransferase involved in cell wall biosynthesis
VPPTIGIDVRKLADFGIGTYVRGLLGGLARQPLAARFVLFAGRAAREAGLPELDERFRVVPCEAAGYSLRELAALGGVLRDRHLGLDLFHATHYVLPYGLPCPAVVTVHDLIHLARPEQLPGVLARLYARLLLRRAAHRARRLLTVSTATARDLERRLGVDPERIEVVPNGVDPVFFADPGAGETTATLAAHGLRSPYLLFLGNPKPHKNLPRLLAAYARLDPATSPPLVLAGARPAELEALQAAVAQAGLGERVICLGHLPAAALPALYRGATLFLFPSLHEGFGLPVLEAMAAGTPVVCSEIPPLRELAAGSAELVDPLSPGAIAAGLAGLLGDPPRRAALAARGRERARAYGWEITAARTAAVYTAALNPPPTGGEAA